MAADRYDHLYATVPKFDNSPISFQFGSTTLSGNGVHLIRYQTARSWVSGQVYHDTNANGQHDAGEGAFPQTVVLEDDASSQYASTELLSGNYVFALDTGAYHVRVAAVPPNYQLQAGRTGYTGHLTAYGFRAVNNDFGLSPIPNRPDLRVTLTPYSPARRGIPVRYKARVTNVGTVAVGGSVAVTVDPAAVIVTTIPAATTQGQTCTWAISMLAPLESQEYELMLNVALGQTVTFAAAVTSPVTDVSLGNNRDTLRQTVVGSYDLNDIWVNHTTLTAAQIAGGVPLDYVVNFQNIGTDTAFAVSIQDSLPAGLLQLATIEVLD